jgi:hypothetical protein
MAGNSGSGNPALPDPRPSDPEAGTPVASRPAGKSQPPQPVAASGSAGAYPDGRRKLPRKKIVIPAVLAGLGVVLGIAALLVYPTTSQLPAPIYTTLVFQAPSGIDSLSYQVDQVSPDLAEVKIAVLLSTSTTSTVPAGQQATLTVFPPLGTPFQPCPRAFCKRAPSQTYGWVQPLTFRPGVGPSELPDVTAAGTYAFLNLFVRARDFGVTYNGVTAAAAIPKLIYNAPGEPNLVTQYRIPAARLYDWSAVPPGFASSSKALWLEAVSSNGVLPPAVATGTNHANDARNTNLTFLAGALVGLAGGALLSAVQEALHATD